MDYHHESSLTEPPTLPPHSHKNFALLQVEQNISTAHHPQTDGQSECTNQWLEQYLCIFRNFHQNDWAHWLSLAQYTHNLWPNATTKKTPFKLITGHTPQVHQPTCTSTSPSVSAQLQQMKESQQQAKDAVKQAQELITRVPSKFIPYNVRDSIWLKAWHLNTSHPSAKLVPKCYRPCRAKETISHTSFQLQLPPSWKIHPVFHASLLTPYKETKEHRINFPEPPPNLINGQPEWEVENVLGSQWWCNQLQYLVRWEGFSEAHDSWKPLIHINANHLIEDFHWKNLVVTRTTWIKTTPTCQLNPNTFCCTTIIHHIMTTTPPSTISSPFTGNYTSLLLNPPLSLEQRIEDASPALSLIEHIDSPTATPLPDSPVEGSPHPQGSHLSLEDQISDLDYENTHIGSPELYYPMSPTIANLSQGNSARELKIDLYCPGFVWYDHIIANHTLYMQKIWVGDGHNEWVHPHYIHSDYNFETHQHYMVGEHNIMGPNPGVHEWPLEAAPFTGPSPQTSDNYDLSTVSSLSLMPTPWWSTSAL